MRRLLAALVVGSLGGVLLPAGPAAAVASPTSPCPIPTGIGSFCPTLDAPPMEGRRLTTTVGTWSGDPAPTFSFQWQACAGPDDATCSDLDSETEQSYVVPTGTVLRYRVVVTATNSAGSGTRASLISTVTTANGDVYPGSTGKAPPVVIFSAPPVVGTSFRGEATRTPQPPLFDEWFTPAAVQGTSYDWRRCAADGTHCVTIPGTHDRDYAATPADVGHTLRFRVTGTGSGGQGQTTSEASPVIGAAPAPQLRLEGGARQELSRHVRLLVSSDRATTVQVRGTLVLLKPTGKREAPKGRSILLPAVSGQVTAGATASVDLHLTRAQLLRTRRLLVHGGRARVVVAVSAPGTPVLTRTVRLVLPR